MSTSPASLSEDVRRELVAHWLRRSRNEWRVGLAFAQLEERSRGFAADVVRRLLQQSAAQELRHSESCHAMAERYAGTSLSPVEAPSAVLPTFGADSEGLELALQIVGLCCINETLATAWLRHCLAIATVPFAVDANRRHLRDEIDHARLGWAHLASPHVSADDKVQLAARVPELIRVNLAAWEEPRNFLPSGAVSAAVLEHGQPSFETSRAVLRDAARRVLLPGFVHVGIPIDPTLELS